MANLLSSHSFGWNEATSRYYDVSSGRFVSTQVVMRALEEGLVIAQNDITIATERMIAGTISLPMWQLTMENEIKLINTAAAALARGGWSQMTQADWGWVGRRIRTQYEYLRNFAKQLESGEQVLNGTVLVRAKMYAQAARDTYEEMRRRYARLYKAAVNERRILDPLADHCLERERPGCVELAARGVQPIGTLPPIGAAQCLTFCRCHYEFYDILGNTIGG